MKSTVQELLEQFGTMAAADRPEDMFDQLSTGFADSTNASNAEVDRLNAELIARDAEIKELQAHNYQLMRSASAANSAPTDDGADGPDGDVIEPDDGDEPTTLEDELFTEKESDK